MQELPKSFPYFLSYSRQNSAAAEFFRKVLRGTGDEVFFDRDSIEPGEDWQQKINTVIAECSVLYLLWSLPASRSPHVKDEWRLAITLGKRIVTITLDDTAVAEELTRFNFIDGSDLIVGRPTPTEKVTSESAPTTHGLTSALPPGTAAQTNIEPVRPPMAFSQKAEARETKVTKLPWFIAMFMTGLSGFLGGMMARPEAPPQAPSTSLVQLNQRQDEGKFRQLIIMELLSTPSE
jgi:hypothetical protein